MKGNETGLTADGTRSDRPSAEQGDGDSLPSAVTAFYERVERRDAPMIGLRLSAELYAAVLAEARREGLPVVEVVRGILRAWAAAHSQTERRR